MAACRRRRGQREKKTKENSGRKILYSSLSKGKTNTDSEGKTTTKIPTKHRLETSVTGMLLIDLFHPSHAVVEITWIGHRRFVQAQRNTIHSFVIFVGQGVWIIAGSREEKKRFQTNGPSSRRQRRTFSSPAVFCRFWRSLWEMFEYVRWEWRAAVVLLGRIIHCTRLDLNACVLLRWSQYILDIETRLEDLVESISGAKSYPWHLKRQKSMIS